ncbi:MAG: hypothetical protein RQ966_16915 [Acetobacteraceae bacterium]|nr:hypothetical protein [Acetobacteraceae bacterium]
MSVFVQIDSFDAIPAAIGRMQAAGAGHRVPILQALYRGEIAHLELGRGASASAFKRWAAAIQLPGLALLGDDDHAAADGPDTWPIAGRVLRWARFVLIHGGTGYASHYEYAVALAKRYRRLLIIECTSANIAAWESAASKWCSGAEGLVMCPPAGEVHPAPSKPRDLH